MFFVLLKTNRNSSISCSQGWLTTHCTAKKDQEILTFFSFIIRVLGLQVYTAIFGLFDAKDQTWVLCKLGQHWTIWVKSPGRSPSVFPQGFAPPSQEHGTAQPQEVLLCWSGQLWEIHAQPPLQLADGGLVTYRLQSLAEEVLPLTSSPSIVLENMPMTKHVPILMRTHIPTHDFGKPSHLWLSPAHAAVLELHPWETHHCRHWTRASTVTSHLTSQFPSGAMSSSTDVFKIMKQKHALLTALDASPVCVCLSGQNRVLKHARLSFNLQIRKDPPWLTVEKKRKVLEALRSFEIAH